MNRKAKHYTSLMKTRSDTTNKKPNSLSRLSVAVTTPGECFTPIPPPLLCCSTILWFNESFAEKLDETARNELLSAVLDG